MRMQILLDPPSPPRRVARIGSGTGLLCYLSSEIIIIKRFILAQSSNLDKNDDFTSKRNTKLGKYLLYSSSFAIIMLNDTEMAYCKCNTAAAFDVYRKDLIQNLLFIFI